MPWGRLAGGGAAQAAALRAWLASLLAVLHECGALAMPPLSRSMETNVGAGDVDEEGYSGGEDEEDEEGARPGPSPPPLLLELLLPLAAPPPPAGQHAHCAPAPPRAAPQARRAARARWAPLRRWW